jgi:type I restriction enzyme S subunit
MEPESTIPWEERALFAIATWQNGLAFRSSHFSERGQPVIKIAELKNGITGQTRYTEQEFDAQMRVSAGDVLFAWSGSPDTSIDTFRWMGPDGWLNQHIFKVTSGPDVDQDFLFGLLRALRPTFVKIARDKQTTGLGHVTLDDLRRLRIHLPPYEEQRRIAGVLGALDNKIEHNERLGARARDVADSRFRESFLALRGMIDGRSAKS